MVIFLSTSLQLRGHSSELILVFTCLSFLVNDLRFCISERDLLKSQFLGQEVDFVLLLGCEVVVRFLNEVKLLLDYLDLTLKLVVLLGKGISFLSGRAELLVRRGVFGVHELFFLREILDLALELVDLIGKLVIVRFDDDVEILLLESLLLKALIAESISLIFLHHHIVVSLEQFDHLILLNLLSQFKIETFSLGIEAIIFSSDSSKTFALHLIQLLAQNVIFMQKLLLVPFELLNLLQFAVVVGFKLLHELLIRLKKRRILN